MSLRAGSRRAGASARLVRWVLSDIEGLSPLSLRFSAPETEEGFVKARTAKLVVNAYYMALINMTGCLGIMFIIFGRYRRRDEIFHPDGVWVPIWQMIILGSVVVITLAVALIAKVPKLLSLIGLFVRERLVVGCALVCMLGYIFGNRYYLMKLGGQEPEDVYIFAEDIMFTDTVNVLSLMGLMVITHQGVPLRWCSLVVIEFFGVLFHGYTSFVLVSPERDNTSWIFFLFVAIVYMLAHGKRATELVERQAFLRLINEMQLRCEAEHRLSRVTGQKALTAAGTSSESAATLGTGHIFGEGLGHALDAQQQLQSIIEIGRKEHWLLSEDGIRLWPERILGSGSFGTVVVAALHGTPVAMKLAKHTSLGPGRQARYLAQLGNELRVLRHVRHPHIAQFHGACATQSGDLLLFLELVSGCQLADFCGTPVRPGATPSFEVTVGICRALVYLHTRQPRIVHGDLKDTNVMVERLQTRAVAKVLDFGLSRVLTAGALPLGGTMRWMAPELLGDDLRPPDPAADVFSFGLLAFFIATGIRPLNAVSSSRIRDMVKTGSLQPPPWPDPGDCVLDMRGVVELCSQREPLDRPSISKILDELIQFARQQPSISPGGGDFGLEPSSDLLDGIAAVRLARGPSARPGPMTGADERQGAWWARNMAQRKEGRPAGTVPAVGSPPESKSEAPSGRVLSSARVITRPEEFRTTAPVEPGLSGAGVFGDLRGMVDADCLVSI